MKGLKKIVRVTDLQADRQTDLLTDKAIHRGAPLLKITLTIYRITNDGHSDGTKMCIYNQ